MHAGPTALGARLRQGPGGSARIRSPGCPPCWVQGLVLTGMTLLPVIPGGWQSPACCYPPSSSSHRDVPTCPGPAVRVWPESVWERKGCTRAPSPQEAAVPTAGALPAASPSCRDTALRGALDRGGREGAPKAGRPGVLQHKGSPGAVPSMPQAGVGALGPRRDFRTGLSHKPSRGTEGLGLVSGAQLPPRRAALLPSPQSPLSAR